MKRTVTAMMVLLTGMLYAVFCQAQILGTGQLGTARRAHTATLLDGGKVLIVGGDNQNGMVGPAEVFDPVANTSSPGASLITARTDHSATKFTDGRVLVIGGRDQNGALTSSEIYNPLTATFTAGPSLTTPRSGHTATVLSDGRILVAGGDAGASAELYNSLTENFSLLAASMNAGRKFHSAIRTSSGQVLIVGGVNAQNTVLNTAEIYDPASQSFYPPPTDLKTPRALATLKLLADGKVQLIGGDADFSMEIFDPGLGWFNALALLPPTIDSLGATLSTQSRAALISPTISQDQFLQGVLTHEHLALLDRADHSITELPAQNKALVAGGISSGQILNSAILVSSSSASVTTDKTDYAPGSIVTITGSGFQPNEPVNISLHETPEDYPDPAFIATADGQGNFTSMQFSPQQIDLGRTFILTAKGATSGFTAQTIFTDAVNIDTHAPDGANCAGAGKTVFTFGETVCAQASGLGNSNHTIKWFDAGGTLQRTTTTSGGSFADQFVPGSTGLWSVKVFATSTSTTPEATATFTVNPGAATKLSFITAAFTRVVGQCSPTITVQTQNASGTPTNPTSNTTVNLSSSSGGGAFFSDAACTSSIPNVTILTSGNTASFFYKESAAGTPTITASATGLTSDTQIETINKADQTITITTPAPADAFYNASFNVAATGGGSGNPVLITSAGVCSGSGSNSASILMTSGTGTCTVKYNQAGNDNYNAATEKTSDTTAKKIDPTVTFTGATATAPYQGTFTVASTTNSSSSPVYTSSGVCSNVSTLYTMTSGTGTCTSTVTWAADSNYNGATRDQTTTATRIDPTVTFTGAPASAPYQSTFTVASTTNSSSSPVYTSGGVCSNVSTLYTMTSGTGTCTSTVTWTADSNYNGATRDQTTTATKIDQTINVTVAAPASAIINTSFNVAAAAGGSGNPVIFSSSGACTNVGANFTMSSSVGICTVKYNQAGNANYNPAPEVTQYTNVIFNFTGFFRPIDNLPIVNKVNAGSSVPIKFSLNGYQGMNIFASGYPRSAAMACGSAPSDYVDEILTPGSSGLTYDPSTDQYHYVWKTEKSWSNSCRRLAVMLSDGQTYYADFSFKK